MYFFDRIEADEFVEFKLKQSRYWLIEGGAIVLALYSISAHQLSFVLALIVVFFFPSFVCMIDGVDKYFYLGRGSMLTISTRKFVIRKADMIIKDKMHVAPFAELGWYIAVVVAILFALVYVYFQ